MDREALLERMFVACHPVLPVASAVALVLHELCGVPGDAGQVAAARETLRAAGIEPGLAIEELPERLTAVLHALHTMFETHPAAALQLSEQLIDALPTPPHHALHALFLLEAARLPASTDEHGAPVPLERQDRTRWDRALIERGMGHLAAAKHGGMSRYHYEAAIAACHALAPSHAETPWRGIAELEAKLAALN